MKGKPANVQWDADPLAWSRDSGLSDRLLEAVRVREKRRRTRRSLAGGTAALVLLAAGLWHAPWRQAGAEAPAPSGRAVVSLPERRTLPDGTIVELKPGAALRVDFAADSPGPRAVTLVKGEALFQVAKNPNRAFIVAAAGVRFRAVGTAFTVGLRESSVGMLVTEGRVAVERGEDGGQTADGLSVANVGPPDPNRRSRVSGFRSLMVDAGQRVDVPLAPQAMPEILQSTAADQADRLAWRVPRLEFNDTPLWEAVSLLNQHSVSRISLADADLGRVEISGALRADNIEPLLQVLEANYRIKVIRRDSGGIELRPAQP